MAGIGAIRYHHSALGSCIHRDRLCDPFADTSTFMVRLLQSGIIKPEDLARKYASELFATEIMLLAYYVSAVNIETTYNALRAEEAKRNNQPEPAYEPFMGIALADTFQIHEDGDIPDLEIFAENNASIERQKQATINVVIGNPPYSAGQTSANDLNANQKYPSLDARIAETYAAKSTAQLKNSLYDSYLRAFRWATDRIGGQGVVAFVSNGGWIDGNTGDGVRLSMAEDFTDLYVFNLRGNQCTAGEQSRKEGGKVFGSGNRSTIAITIGIKDPAKQGFELHYRAIGYYLSAEEKLDVVDKNSITTLEWQTITPNAEGDWLNQRSEDFGSWPSIHESFFATYSGGLKTNRDVWAYNFDLGSLASNVQLCMDTFNRTALGDPIESTQVKWSSKFDQLKKSGITLEFESQRMVQSLYRPYCSQFAYFSSSFDDRCGKLPTIFPTQEHHNIGFYLPAASSAAREFNALATNLLPDLCLSGSGSGQFFPRFTWASVDAGDGGLFGAVNVGEQGEASVYGQVGEVVDGYVRVDNVTDEIKSIYRSALGENISGDDIFHFVYGKLHDPEYRETYAADLKKMLPHIETPSSREEFDKFASAGAELMALHVVYGDLEPYPLDIQVKGDENDRETWRVVKPKWAKKKDPETGKNINDVTKMIYNKNVTIAGIPAEAEEYMLGSRSALAWIIDRYQVKKDKASGIVNDPNDWADEVGNPRYIVDLVGKVTRVAVETVRIVESLR